MSYLKLTNDRIEQRLSSFEDMREKEVKCQVVNIEKTNGFASSMLGKNLAIQR